jgi:hypothetical protein
MSKRQKTECAALQEKLDDAMITSITKIMKDAMTTELYKDVYTKCAEEFKKMREDEHSIRASTILHSVYMASCALEICSRADCGIQCAEDVGRFAIRHCLRQYGCKRGACVDIHHCKENDRHEFTVVFFSDRSKLDCDVIYDSLKKEAEHSST